MQSCEKAINECRMRSIKKIMQANYLLNQKNPTWNNFFNCIKY